MTPFYRGFSLICVWLLISSVEGVGISLSSIGITSKSRQDNGKLTIDEDKLKQAIREKPDEVRNLFIQDPKMFLPTQGT